MSNAGETDKKVNVTNIIILNCYKTYDTFLNQHDEKVQKEIQNDMKTFLNFEDLEEQREFILNLRREKGMKICDFSLLNLNLKKYCLKIRGIVQKNNFFTEDFEEFPFARISCGDFAVGKEEN